MKLERLVFITLFFVGMTSCSNNTNKTIDIANHLVEDSVETNTERIVLLDTTRIASKESKEIAVKVPKFSIISREREDYDNYTPRTRYKVRIPKNYDESDLDLIADSLLLKERNEFRITEIYVNFFLKGSRVDYSNQYAISVRLRTSHSTSIEKREQIKPRGYNPPKARDLSRENIRAQQLWGAFDRGEIAGYEAGYLDGKKKRKVYTSFNSNYPIYDEWIEQSYKQGYEIGYLNGFDDAGGIR